MRSWTKWATFLPILAVFLLLPSQAEGAGLVVYHYGENVKEIGEVTEEHQESIRTELDGPAQVGFVHNAFGLFWLDIWTWDGRFCLYRGDQYWEIDAEQAAVFLGQPAGELLGKPIFYTFPPGLLALIAIGAIYIPYKIISARNEKKLERLFVDSRYQQALKMLSDQADQATQTAGGSSQGSNGFEDSVAHLRREGISDEEARRDLTLMINTIAAHQQERAEEQG